MKKIKGIKIYGQNKKDDLSPAEQLKRLESHQVDLGFQTNSLKLVKKYSGR